MSVTVLFERELPTGLVIQRKRFEYPDLRPWEAYGAFYREGNLLDYCVGLTVREAVGKLHDRVAWKVGRLAA